MNVNEAYRLAYSTSKVLRRRIWCAGLILKITDFGMSLEEINERPDIYKCYARLSNEDLSATDWEVVKEKVKKYQVLFKGTRGLFDTTLDYHKNREEFEKIWPPPVYSFHSLIMESEKEFDE